MRPDRFTARRAAAANPDGFAAHFFQACPASRHFDSNLNQAREKLVSNSNKLRLKYAQSLNQEGAKNAALR
jgi:hypothetical protein